MCGIIAVKGNGAINKTIEGLSRLEYRGYDSCGIAFLNENKIDIYKAVGYVEVLADKLRKAINNSETINTTTIAHTRWATHGGVNEINCHPHISEDGMVAVVHNGIIENYKDIKEDVLSNVKFDSETDTEIIPNLISKYISDGNSVLDAIYHSMRLLKGSYAIAILIKDDNKLYFAKNGSPLVVAKCVDNYVVASDVNGFKGEYEVFYLENGMFGCIDKIATIYDNKYKEIDINYINKTNEITNKNNGCDFMLSEIYEMPIAIERTYNKMMQEQYLLPHKIEHVLIVGCGTSYHSGLMGKKYIEQFAEVSCECEVASEFIYNKYICRKNTLAIFISQSGETADTLQGMRKAKQLGLMVLAITNVKYSTIYREADECIVMSAGPEIAVASTKAYSTQVFVLLQLSNMIKNINNNMFVTCNDCVECKLSECKNYLPCTNDDYEDLFRVDVSQFEKCVDVIASILKNRDGIHFIGKNYDYITAMEGSLKLKEISYKFTDAYPAGELKHGTLSLIDDNSYSVVIATDFNLLSKSKNSINEIIARGGKVVVCTAFVEEFGGFDNVIDLPKLNSVFLPIVSIIPIDLLAYKVTKLLGFNPDKPRNLAKSVTVE